ncbi:hypothetical protein [Amycolatopsis sp.]|jgi:hypothetical protein|uniref:hypothetical protein n=1 Tax=Amycolatopsis sp. TaxID=37632 RepID=UPI002E03DBA7|nr:hypothetical protein [Amycolatopsis sp.]
MSEDRRIETHPELMDPDWQKHAEREAWTEVKRSKRGSDSPRTKRPALWVSLGLVALVVGAVALNQLRDTNANDNVTTPQNALPQYAKVDLAQPFARTPAADWKDGAAGFTVPAPAAVGAFSAEEVASAYDQVTKAVVQSRLDRKMLIAHDPSAYLALFSTNEAKRVKEILDKPDKTESAAFVTLVADGFTLLPSGPKLSGRLSAKPGAEEGELIIHAEYLIAYAFDTAKPEDLMGPGDIVAFSRKDEDFSLLKGSRYYDEDLGLRSGAGDGMTYSMACEPAKAGYLAPAYSEKAPTSSSGSGEFDEDMMYNLDKEMTDSDGCK